MHSNRIRLKARRSFNNSDGWSSRGYLPHFNSSGVIQFITIRLADSLPRHVCAALQAELGRLEADGAAPQLVEQQWRKRTEALLDAGYGACVLAREEVAEIVVKSIGILVVNGHEVLRWVVMPNHVHLLLKLQHGFELSSVIRSFKGRTGREVNRVLGSTGRFWYPEFFDRYIRDADHLDRVVGYIDDNPVRAGLVTKASDWRFGSVGYRWGEGRGGRSA
jgi:REP element-mobilizing transposase RayT